MHQMTYTLYRTGDGAILTPVARGTRRAMNRLLARWRKGDRGLVLYCGHAFVSSVL